jgi:hypothetical protein
MKIVRAWLTQKTNGVNLEDINALCALGSEAPGEKDILLIGTPSLKYLLVAGVYPLFPMKKRCLLVLGVDPVTTFLAIIDHHTVFVHITLEVVRANYLREGVPLN